MASKFRTRRQKIQPHPFVAMGIIVLLIAFIAFALAVHWLGWDWTGFTGYSPPTPQYQRGKTLWDLLQLLAALAIPIIVGFGAAWFTAQQGKVSERENKDNQREVALQAYIDKMSELLLVKHLREASPEDEVRNIARVRTLTVLRGLDGVRKGSILQFLYESHLIDTDKQLRCNFKLVNPRYISLCDKCRKLLDSIQTSGEACFDLPGADLEDESRKASLAGAGSFCDKCGARFEVVMDIVDLRGADLREADLREALQLHFLPHQ